MEYLHEISKAIRRRYTYQKLSLFGKSAPQLIQELGPQSVFSFENPEQEIRNATSLGDVVVLNHLMGGLFDIVEFVRELRNRVNTDTRVVLVETKYFWQPIISFIEKIKTGKPPRAKSWLSHLDIENILGLNGFEIVSYENRLLFPWDVPILSPFFNRLAVKLPVFSWFSILRIYFLRPVAVSAVENNKNEEPIVSVVVPARNEKGNIERCVREIPVMGRGTELIFVEGGSKDGTREEIERVMASYQGPLELKLCVQTKADGKGGAVRIGFDAARGDILMIQDADLTAEPRELPKFYRALVEGHGEMIMGSRLVYPLEKQAMRTLNILGNKAFSVLFTWLLDRPVKDTLCGTKVLSKASYEVIKKNRYRFGEFDPFGDYDLLFGAALQNYKIVEIPVRYYPRTYGTTNISRFAHGWLLLKMCGFAFRRLKLN